VEQIARLYRHAINDCGLTSYEWTLISKTHAIHDFLSVSALVSCHCIIHFPNRLTTMSSTAAVTPIHPLLLNDEIFAWQLCSQEVQDTTHSISKKNSLTNEPDLEVALDFYLEEIQARLEFLNDMKLAHDIASADEADFVAIAEAARKEVHVREDQNYAFRISNEDQTLEAPIVSNSDDKLRVLEEETFHKLASLLADDQDENYTESECEAGPSVPYVQRQEKALQDAQKKACVSCMDNFDEESMMKLDCGDQYCHRCLKRVIMSAINSRNLNLLPPRCHRIPIPATIITEILTDEDLRRFERAKAEKYSKIKIYCTAVDCGEFIDSSLIKGITATCPRCNEKTCVRCKAPSHEGECAPDEDVRPTFVLGGDKNWQRCYSCSRLVEKMGFGCNHMTLVSARRHILAVLIKYIGAGVELSSAMFVVPNGFPVIAIVLCWMKQI
jgi:hypothetical protein